MIVPSERSYEKIRAKDLLRLSQLTLDNLDRLFARKPKLGNLFRDRLLAVCLCGGAAEHFVRGRDGVNNFVLWVFFRRHSGRAFPWGWRPSVDFGPSRFGRNPEDIGFEGRRINIAGRSINVHRTESGIDAIRRYLRKPPTSAAWDLSRNPVVIVSPAVMAGTTIWDGAG
jgi:hypothetical protein